LIPNESTVVMVTRDGYIKRLPPDTFRTQSRGGKGVIGLTTKEEDMIDQFFSTNTHADLMFFTTRGRVFKLKAYEVPAGSRQAKGQAIVNFLQLAPEEKVSAILSLEDLSPYKYLVMVTRQAFIKKVALEAFNNVRRSGLIAIKLKDGDVLEWIKPSSGKDNVILITGNGQSIRFKKATFGRWAGRRLVCAAFDSKKMICYGHGCLDGGKAGATEQLLVVMSNGYGKRTKLTAYKIQHRGGSGIRTAKITTKTGKIIGGFIVDAKREKEDIIIISEKGQVIRLQLKSVNVIGRDTQGVRLMRFKDENDKAANITFV
jgi:DNA gyrase subunit A